jgi:hypothetical protein
MSLYGCPDCRNKRKSGTQGVRVTFKGILISANDRLPICCLEQSSFSYDMPDDGITKIDGYLHVNKSSLLANTAAVLSERSYSMIESSEKLYGPGDWRPLSTRSSELETSLLLATAVIIGWWQNLPSVALRIGWARARIRSVGEGAPGTGQKSAVRRPAENGGSEADPGGCAPLPCGWGRPARPPLMEKDTAVLAAAGGGPQQAQQHARGYPPHNVHHIDSESQNNLDEAHIKGVSCESVSEHAQQARAACRTAAAPAALY